MLPPPPPAEGPDLRPIEGAEADEELATLGKAMGTLPGCGILRILSRKSACVCGDIVDEPRSPSRPSPSTSRCSRKRGSSGATSTARGSATASNRARCAG